MKQFTCAICGSQFLADRKNAICCSRKCAGIRATQLAPGKTKYQRVCEVCSTPFETVDKRQYCCSLGCASRKHHLAQPTGEKRFWSNVDKSAGLNACWPWMGKNKVRGYGRFKVEGKAVLTHRFVYELIYGPLPPGYLVCHSCDNPPCCNPSHLFKGTYKDNSDDKVAKGRHSRGETCKKAKLTDQQVAEIRRLYRTGEYSTSKLGKLFNCNRGYINALVRYKYRKDVA